MGIHVDCPSGFAGELRPLTGAELVMLNDRASAGNGGAGIGEVLRSCWVATTDPGPYPWAEVGGRKFDWRSLFDGDAIKLLLALRISSVKDGDMLDFPVICPDHPRDMDPRTAKFEHRIASLTNHLTEKKLAPEDTALLRSGEPFRTTIRGAEATFVPTMLGDAERMRLLLRRLSVPRPSPIENLTIRVRSVEGVTGDDLARRRFFTSLELHEIQDIQEAIDAHDCGLETGIVLRCPTCGNIWESDVPFVGSCFSPVRRKTGNSTDTAD